MTGLSLHPKLGVNPKLTFCPRCGGDGSSLILVGIHEYKGTCTEHGLVYGARFKCPGCKGTLSDVKKIGEHERLPDSQPCVACEKEIKEHEAIVADGGVYWRCAECKRSGVVKPSPFASAVRSTHNIEKPKPCGVEFAGCTEHQPKDKE